MHLSTKGLSVLVSLIAATSAETATEDFLRNVDTFARYAAFGYCDFLTDGKDVNSGTKVCTNGGIPNGCGDLTDSVVVMEFPSSEGVAGYVAVNNETQQIVVSFRGTGSARDVLADLKTCKTRSGRAFWGFLGGVAEMVGDGIGKIAKSAVINIVKATCSLVGESEPDLSDTLLPICQDCRIHTGFFEGFKGIKNKMLTTVQQQKTLHPTFEVVITGYSLGAAIATLSAAYIRKTTMSVDLYTFGSPRVGDKKFAEFVSSQGHGRNFRITNANDPVTNVPWADPDFAHVSPEYWFSKGIATKEMDVCNGVDNVGCSGQFNFKLEDVALGKERMKPHLWQNYAIGFPFTGPTSCPGRSGRQIEDAPFTKEEITEMKKLAGEGN